MMHIQDFLGSGHSRVASNPDAARAAQLLFDVQPSAYVNGSEINVHGEGTKVVHANASSLQAINSLPAAAKASAEALFIKIESASDKSSPINLSLLSGFPNMKYVYILSTVNSTPTDIFNALSNHSSYTVFYNIEKAN